MALTKDALREFLDSKTRADMKSIGDDAQLFSSGLVDSFVMFDLMRLLEKQTGARIAPEDLETLDTIQQIMDFAASKQR